MLNRILNLFVVVVKIVKLFIIPPVEMNYFYFSALTQTHHVIPRIRLKTGRLGLGSVKNSRFQDVMMY